MSDSPAFLADLSEFPSVDLSAWRDRVEGELGGRSIETSLSARLAGGLRTAPLYSAESVDLAEPTLPGLFPFLRGDRTEGAASGAWRIVAEVSDADPEAATASAALDRSRGADLIWLPLAAPRRSRGAVEGGSGGGIRTQADLCRVLEAAAAEGAWIFDSGAAVGEVVQGLRRLGEAEARRLATCLGGDPLGALGAFGGLGVDLDRAWQELAESAAWCLEGDAPAPRAALVSAVPAHDAGASPADEIAWALAGGVEALRRLDAAGIATGAAAGQLLFSFGLGCDLFLEIAKLRAARKLWAQVVVASGGSEEAAAMRIHARGSASSSTLRAPRLNLLRATTQGLAAAVAGVWSLCLAPYDEARGRASSRARRLALSTQHLLAEEAHLGRVVDPGGGSWYLEALTDQLARHAWERFRAIESRGGLQQALLSGWIQAEIRRAADERDAAIRTRRQGIVGVSLFSSLEEEGALAAQSLPPLQPDLPVTAEPLAFRRRSRAFDELREITDRLASAGRRPSVALYTLGPRKEHGPRADFARDFFAAGGIESVVVAADDTVVDSPLADGVVLCGADARYPEEVPALAARLRERGARRIFLAGRGGEHEERFRRAGVDTFLYLGCDLVEVLEPFLHDLEAGS